MTLISSVAAGGGSSGIGNIRGDSTGPGNREHLSHSPMPVSAHHLPTPGSRMPLSSVGTTFRKRHDKHLKEN